MVSTVKASESDRSSPTSKLITIAVAAVAALAVAAMPTPPGLSASGQRVLAITVFTTAMWTTEALPLATTSLAAVALLTIGGAVGSLPEALWGFSQPLPYFLYGVLVIGFAAGRSGLATRIARWFLSLARGRSVSLYWQMILSFVVLPFVLPAASARTGVQCPIYHEALLIMKAGPGSRVGAAVMQAQAQLNRIGSSALLTGGMAPVTASALLGGIGWVDWFVLMCIPIYTNLILGAAVVYLSHYPFEPGLTEPAQSLVPEKEAESTDRGAEARVCAIVLMVSILWLTDSWHHMDSAIPALLGAILIVTPGIGVLRWEEVEKGVGVAMMFVTAASLSLAHAVVSSGVAGWLGSWLASWLSPLASTPLLFLMMLLLAAVVARVILSSIVAYLTVLIPVTVALAQSVGLDPLVCGLLITLVGDAVLFYAAQASSCLMPFQYGYLSSWDILRLGLLMVLVAMAVGLFIALPYWAWLGHPLLASTIPAG